VGLVTSASAATSFVTPAADALDGVCTLAALFGPEHGVTAHAADGAGVSSAIDARTGLPIHSLYGETKRPTPDMLEGIDVLVFDIQDVGVRFYTYIWTMSYVLEAAAEHGMPLIVLDRPNPIGGQILEGPVLEPGYASFVGRYLLPVRHGMTVGELAQLFNAEHKLDADLTVVRAEGWRRSMWFDETGLPWIPPSPAMPKLETATVYPGTCLLEGTNVSCGRGTATPFESIGAPWIDGHRLASALNDLSLPGVRFRPTFFTPSASQYAGQTCQGVYLHVLDREAFRPLCAGLHVVSTIVALWPTPFEWRETSWEGRPPHFDLLIGNGWVRECVDEGCSVAEIAARWQTALGQFEALRRQYLLYE
jgi:beta-N-acetylhexosaminidase